MQPACHRDQQLITNLMAVGVVDRLEPVEVREKHGGLGVRATCAECSVLETLLEQRTVRQTREWVVQRAVPQAVGRLAGLGPSLGVQQVRGRYVGQRLRGLHVLGVEGTGGLPIEVERAELPVLLTEREGEDSGKAGRQRPGRERGKPGVEPQVGDCYRLAALVRRDARPLGHLGLQHLIAKGGLVGRGDVPRLLPRRDQRHSGGADGQYVDDPLDEVVEDRLDRKVGQEGTGESTSTAESSSSRPTTCRPVMRRAVTSGRPPVD